MTTMNPDLPLPGTPRHQALLRAVVDFYSADPRVLAVILFGSLGRGNWDALSDLDLDIIMEDVGFFEIVVELHKLCQSFAPLGEKAALITTYHTGDGDIVLESLAQLSIRFHILDDTNPAILGSMRVLRARIDEQAIVDAGMSHNISMPFKYDRCLDIFTRYALVAAIAVKRGRFWMAEEILHRMRGLLLELFTYTCGYGRPLLVFEEEAAAKLQDRLGQAIPRYGIKSARSALLRLIKMVDKDMPELGHSRASLSDPQRLVLQKVRKMLLD